MPLYIDADKLYKETQKKIKEENSQGLAVMDDEFLDLIDNTPAADVVPKSEVAREIFEEIEKHFVWYPRCYEYIINELDYEKVKNKYTESEE